MNDGATQYASQLAQIRALLGSVSVFEGLLEASPTVLMVAELVRDHEELEARIDAIAMVVAAVREEHESDHRHGHVDAVFQLPHLLNEISRLIQGGDRVPSTPEEWRADGGA
jgi:hypothetical protein